MNTTDTFHHNRIEVLGESLWQSVGIHTDRIGILDAMIRIDYRELP